MQSKAMERSSCVSLSPVSLVWVKVHPFAETKQTHHGLNLHRDATQATQASTSTQACTKNPRKKEKEVVSAYLPWFLHVNEQSGAIFWNPKWKRNTQNKVFTRSTWNYKMWLSAKALKQTLLQVCGLLPDNYCGGLCAQTGMWKLSCSTCWLDSQMVEPEGMSP